MFWKKDVQCEFKIVTIDVAVADEYCGSAPGAYRRTGVWPEDLRKYGAAEWQLVSTYTTTEIIQTAESESSQVKVQLVKAVLRRTVQSSYFGK